ncbi:MAG: hypothetical protein ACD_28C00366G0001, partial [uncultured bacterium]
TTALIRREDLEKQVKLVAESTGDFDSQRNRYSPGIPVF